jgi:hypothetical protein
LQEIFAALQQIRDVFLKSPTLMVAVSLYLAHNYHNVCAILDLSQSGVWHNWAQSPHAVQPQCVVS